MNKPNVIKDKSFAFALDVIEEYKLLVSNSKEYVMSKQLLRAGTAVGALYREAEHAESNADFIHKMAIAQKECNEVIYWLELLSASDYLNDLTLISKSEELMRIITAIIKTTKSRM